MTSRSGARKEPAPATGVPTSATTSPPSATAASQHRHRHYPYDKQHHPDGFVRDFVTIAEFCEVQGPITVRTIPRGLQHDFLDDLAKHILATDTQTQRGSGFRIAKDTNIITNFPTANLHLICTYLHLCDVFARGLSRTYCICYVTQDQEKVLSHAQQIIEATSAVSKLLHFSNLTVFSSEVHEKLENLQMTFMGLTTSTPKDEEEKKQAEELKEKVSAEIKRFVHVITQIDQYLNAPERARLHARLEEEVPRKRMTRTGSINANSQQAISRGRGTSVHSSDAFVPIASTFSLHKPFSDGLRSLRAITHHFYDEAMTIIKKLHRHYHRDISVLYFEMDEVHLLDDPSTLLTIGRCVVLNFAIPERLSFTASSSSQDSAASYYSSGGRVSSASSSSAAMRRRNRLNQSRTASSATGLTHEMLSQCSHNVDQDSFTMDAFDTSYLSTESPLQSFCIEADDNLSFHTALGDYSDLEDEDVLVDHDDDIDSMLSSSILGPLTGTTSNLSSPPHPTATAARTTPQINVLNGQNLARLHHHHQKGKKLGRDGALVINTAAHLASAESSAPSSVFSDGMEFFPATSSTSPTSPAHRQASTHGNESHAMDDSPLPRSSSAPAPQNPKATDPSAALSEQRRQAKPVDSSTLYVDRSITSYGTQEANPYLDGPGRYATSPRSHSMKRKGHMSRALSAEAEPQKARSYSILLAQAHQQERDKSAPNTPSSLRRTSNSAINDASARTEVSSPVRSTAQHRTISVAGDGDSLYFEASDVDQSQRQRRQTGEEERSKELNEDEVLDLGSATASQEELDQSLNDTLHSQKSENAAVALLGGHNIIRVSSSDEGSYGVRHDSLEADDTPVASLRFALGPHSPVSPLKLPQHLAKTSKADVSIINGGRSEASPPSPGNSHDSSHDEVFSTQQQQQQDQNQNQKQDHSLIHGSSLQDVDRQTTISTATLTLVHTSAALPTASGKGSESGLSRGDDVSNDDTYDGGDDDHYDYDGDGRHPLHTLHPETDASARGRLTRMSSLGSSADDFYDAPDDNNDDDDGDGDDDDGEEGLSRVVTSTPARARAKNDTDEEQHMALAHAKAALSSSSSSSLALASHRSASTMLPQDSQDAAEQAVAAEVARAAVVEEVRATFLAQCNLRLGSGEGTDLADMGSGRVTAPVGQASSSKRYVDNYIFSDYHAHSSPLSPGTRNLSPQSNVPLPHGRNSSSASHTYAPNSSSSGGGGGNYRLYTSSGSSSRTTSSMASSRDIQERKRLLHQQAHAVQSAADHVCYYSKKKPGAGVTTFLRDYPKVAKNIIFSLLSGRTVIVAGAKDDEETVRALVTALWFFVPGHSRYTQVVYWKANAPLSSSDLLTLKLGGLSVKMLRQTRNSILRHVTLLHLHEEYAIFRGPLYDGTMLDRLLSLNLGRYKLESTALALFHKLYLEFARAAYLYYHTFVTLNFNPKKRPLASTEAKSPFSFDKQRRDEFFDDIGIFGSDVDVVLNLVEVVKHQKLLSLYDKTGKDETGTTTCFNLQYRPMIRLKFVRASAHAHVAPQSSSSGSKPPL